jgi:hypothetical protein
MIGFISTSVTSSLNHSYYSAFADLHILQFTFAHALGLSVSTSRLLATDLNTQFERAKTVHALHRGHCDRRWMKYMVQNGVKGVQYLPCKLQMNCSFSLYEYYRRHVN